MEELESLILTVVRSFVSDPEQVKTYTTEAEVDGVLSYKLHLKVAKEDVKICIGREGATADSLRRIASLYAKQHDFNRPVYVRVDAPYIGRNYFEYE